MLNLLRSIVKVFLEPLLLLPMPWRLLIVILILIPCFHWAVWRVFPWLLIQVSQLFLISVETIGKFLLIFEYRFSRKNRIHGYQPPKIVYLLDDLLREIVKLVYTISQQCEKVLKPVLNKKKRWIPRAKWFVQTAIVFLLIWFLRPFIGETQVGKLINSGVNLWYSLESWVITGK